MPPTIEWRRTPDRQHTGSAELLGVAGTPFLYVHPQDWPATAPRASSAARWRYSQADATIASVITTRLGVVVTGRVSYGAYQSQRTGYRALPPAQQTDPWQGQEGTDEVYGPVQGTGIQPSGFLAYHAFLSINPAMGTPTTYEIRRGASGFSSVARITYIILGAG